VENESANSTGHSGHDPFPSSRRSRTKRNRAETTHDLTDPLAVMSKGGRLPSLALCVLIESMLSASER
jgi:hypothetical protein